MPREFDFNDLVGAVVDRWSPATADVPLWTCGLFRLPIDEEVAGIKAFLLASLPPIIGSRGTNEVDVVVLLAVHQQFGIHIPGIDNVLLWQQVFALESFMDECCSGIIRNRGGGRVDRRDQMRAAFFTGFRQMDLLAHPGGRALFAVMRLDIIGRSDVARGGRNVLRRAPADLPLNPGEVLHPDLAQDLHGRDLMQEERGRRIINGAEHACTISPNHFRVGVTGLIAKRGPRIFHARLVALNPLRLAVSQQPVGSHQRQTI